MDFKNTEYRDLPVEIENLVITKSEELSKHRRLKMGCKPSNCEIREILFLKDIICRYPCYITDEDLKNLEQKIIQISNVR